MPPVVVQPVAIRYDVAIVLGAKVQPDGSPSPALARRVAHAVGLVQGGRVGHLLMSGGPVGHPTPEAWVMRDLAMAAGLAPQAVLVEDRSTDTIANARLSAPILAERGWNRLLVVTDSFHLPRALYIFHRHGLAAAGSGTRPARPTGEWALAHVREVFAMMKTVYRLELGPK